MEFNRCLRDELYSILPTQKEELKQEWLGLFWGGGTVKKQKASVFLQFSHRDLGLIKKLLFIQKKLYPKLSHNLYQMQKEGINPGSFFILEFPVSQAILVDLKLYDLGEGELFSGAKEGFHFLRGLFEARGYIDDPGRAYHLELRLNSKNVAEFLLSFLRDKALSFSLRREKEGYNLYSKNAQTIGFFLQAIAASHSYLLFEKTLTEKATLNSLTRWVNCETSNVERTVRSSIRLRNKIQRLGVTSLPKRLKEVAFLRLHYPWASIRELGELCSPPLSKSEVYRRLKEIEKIADQAESASDRFTKKEK